MSIASCNLLAERAFFFLTQAKGKKKNPFLLGALDDGNAREEEGKSH